MGGEGRGGEGREGREGRGRGGEGRGLSTLSGDRLVHNIITELPTIEHFQL